MSYKSRGSKPAKVFSRNTFMKKTMIYERDQTDVFVSNQFLSKFIAGRNSL